MSRDAAPIEIQYPSEPTRERVAQGVKSRTTVAIVAKQSVAGQSVKAILRVRAILLEDEDGGGGDSLPVTVKFAKQDEALVQGIDDEEDDKSFQLEVPKGHSIEIKLATAAYDPEWVAKFQVSLEPPGGKK